MDGSGLTQMDEVRHTTLFTYAFYASLPGLVGGVNQRVTLPTVLHSLHGFSLKKQDKIKARET